MERKKLMAAKPPENPFEKSIKFLNEEQHSKPKASRSTTTPMAVRGDCSSGTTPSVRRSESPLDDLYNLDNMADSALRKGLDGLLMESQSEDEDADWFGMDETVDHDDDSESPD